MIIEPKIMTVNEVVHQGIEFADEVCYSGISGKELYDKPMEEGGIAIIGLIYENYKNGNLAYYSYYVNGIAEGENVNFFESGKVESYKQMIKGVISGDYMSWFENGSLKAVGIYKYGFKVIYREWNIKGELIKEQLQPGEFEQSMIDKYDEWTKES